MSHLGGSFRHSVSTIRGEAQSCIASVAGVIGWESISLNSRVQEANQHCRSMEDKNGVLGLEVLCVPIFSTFPCDK